MSNKITILSENQPCRKCGGQLIRREHKPGWVPNPKKSYYFAWWFHCTQCGVDYLVAEAKRFLNNQDE